jgi:hypothetical protein
VKRFKNFIWGIIILASISCGKSRTVPTADKNRINITAPTYSRVDLYSQLKDSLDFTWLRENPLLRDTQPSYFNEETSRKYFVTPVQVSGFSIPFTWDDNLAILKFLQTKDSDLSINYGVKADSLYKGIKVQWEQPENGLLWIDGKVYNAPIKSWNLFEENECPGTIMFPTLSFQKQFDLPNAVTNQLEGLAIIPYNDDLKQITSSMTVLKSKSGQDINGIGYDLNNDKIKDVFIYIEEINADTGYKRLYLNVGGKWVCKFVKLDEICV